MQETLGRLGFNYLKSLISWPLAGGVTETAETESPDNVDEKKDPMTTTSSKFPFETTLFVTDAKYLKSVLPVLQECVDGKQDVKAETLVQVDLHVEVLQPKEEKDRKQPQKEAVFMLIDCSASMDSSSRMTITQKTVINLLDDFAKEEKDEKSRKKREIHLLPFDVEVSHHEVTDYAQAKKIVQSYRPAHGTNYTVTLEKLQELLNKIKEPSKVTVLFLTDGDPTSGLHITKLEEHLCESDQIRWAKRLIGINCQRMTETFAKREGCHIEFICVAINMSENKENQELLRNMATNQLVIYVTESAGIEKALVAVKNRILSNTICYDTRVYCRAGEGGPLLRPYASVGTTDWGNLLANRKYHYTFYITQAQAKLMQIEIRYKLPSSRSEREVVLKSQDAQDEPEKGVLADLGASLLVLNYVHQLLDGNRVEAKRSKAKMLLQKVQSYLKGKEQEEDSIWAKVMGILEKGFLTAAEKDSIENAKVSVTLEEGDTADLIDMLRYTATTGGKMNKWPPLMTKWWETHGTTIQEDLHRWGFGEIFCGRPSTKKFDYDVKLAVPLSEDREVDEAQHIYEPTSAAQDMYEYGLNHLRKGKSYILSAHKDGRESDEEGTKRLIFFATAGLTFYKYREIFVVNKKQIGCPKPNQDHHLYFLYFCQEMIGSTAAAKLLETPRFLLAAYPVIQVSQYPLSLPESPPASMLLKRETDPGCNDRFYCRSLIGVNNWFEFHVMEGSHGTYAASRAFKELTGSWTRPHYSAFEQFKTHVLASDHKTRLQKIYAEIDGNVRDSKEPLAQRSGVSIGSFIFSGAFERDQRSSFLWLNVGRACGYICTARTHSGHSLMAMGMVHSYEGNRVEQGRVEDNSIGKEILSEVFKRESNTRILGRYDEELKRDLPDHWLLSQPSITSGWIGEDAEFAIFGTSSWLNRSVAWQIAQAVRKHRLFQGRLRHVKLTAKNETRITWENEKNRNLFFEEEGKAKDLVSFSVPRTVDVSQVTADCVKDLKPALPADVQGSITIVFFNLVSK